MTRMLVFLSDGEQSLRQLQCSLRPHSQHLVDWFHLSMRVTSVGQCPEGAGTPGRGAMAKSNAPTTG